MEAAGLIEHHLIHVLWPLLPLLFLYPRPLAVTLLALAAAGTKLILVYYRHLI
jgi:hypothetical protein